MAEALGHSLTAKPVLSVAEMRSAEQAVFDEGTTVYELMQRAGRGAAEAIWRIGGLTPTLILCGPGNNGGDGFVIAEFLRQKGVDVTVAQIGESQSEAAQLARQDYAGPVKAIQDIETKPQIVDAIFGTGQDRMVDPGVMSKLNALVDDAQRRFAIDVPTGVNSDTGDLLNPIKSFTHTLSLGAYKYAHFQGEAADYCGQILLVALPVTAGVQSAQTLARPIFAAPDRNAHKYTRGKVLIVAGEMPGAAILAAMAAYAAGAGYVMVAATTDVPGNVAPDIIWQKWQNERELTRIVEDPRTGAIIIGPGLGRTAESQSTLHSVVHAAKCRLVIDADALHMIAPEDLQTIAGRAILTPHEGEFAALNDMYAAPAGDHHIAKTRDLAEKSGTVLIRKGATSVITDGSHNCTIARSGSSWLSVAGTGDVLSGILGARLAAAGTDKDRFDVACEAQWLHQRASHITRPPYTTSQLIAAVPSAYRSALRAHYRGG